MITCAWASGYSSVRVRWIWASQPGGIKAASRAAAPPVRCSVGRPRRIVDHAHVEPVHALPYAGAERLGAGLLGGETLGVGGGPGRAAIGLGALDFGKTAARKAVAVFFQRFLDAADVAEIDAEADDHALRRRLSRPSSIAARIFRTLASSPMKMASPIRKWPMFNSTICGKPAMIRAVSKSSPWPAWHSRPSRSASCRRRAQPCEFGFGFFRLAQRHGIAPGAGMQFHHRRLDRSRGGERFERRLDEQRNAYAGAKKLDRRRAAGGHGRRSRRARLRWCVRCAFPAPGSRRAAGFSGRCRASARSPPFRN